MTFSIRSSVYSGHSLIPSKHVGDLQETPIEPTLVIEATDDLSEHVSHVQVS